MLLEAIICGFVLDLWLGDPEGWPHPVCLLGRLICALEKMVRKAATSKDGLLAGGFYLALTVCTVAFLVPYLVLELAGSYHKWLRFLLETLMCYQIFATRCLAKESSKVYQALQTDTLPKARQQLGRIVGRDTTELSADQVIKAVIETVAENTTDGVIAPMVYLFLGGAPLGFLYKAINTMDSMIAYKTERYLYVGRCAAKLDDAANYLPARLSAVLMLAAVALLRLDAAGAWRIFKRDRYNHLSPNAGMTESVAAGALQLQLGGTHTYFGVPVVKKTIGDSDRAPVATDIVLINKIMYVTAILGLLFLLLLTLVVTASR